MQEGENHEIIHLIRGLPGLLRVYVAIRELDLAAAPMLLMPIHSILESRFSMDSMESR